ncbi:MAG: hypothetical protein LBF76_00420 [Holosporales bacterium]|jgi:hypothetical protein|nr:hypothetical protein [Holosporales bacterium]
MKRYLFSIFFVCAAFGSLGMTPSGSFRMVAVDQDPFSQRSLLVPFPHQNRSYTPEFEIRNLATLFGYYQQGKTKIVDISYASLCAYASGLSMTPEQQQLFETIQHSDEGALFPLALDLFDCTQLKRFQRTSFEEALRRTLGNPVGRDRVRALQTIQFLIDQQLGEIGMSCYKDKKISVHWGTGNFYEFKAHTLILSFLPEDLILLDFEPKKRPSPIIAKSSSALSHELSHAYHKMLGSSFKCDINMLREAIFAHPLLRERLIPLLNTDVFQYVEQALQKVDFGKDLRAYVHKAFPDDPCYRFLEENNFFGLPRPHLDNPLQSAMTRLICLFIKAWDSSEEILTIAGFVPLLLHDEPFLLVDAQNESFYHLEESQRFRSTHGVMASLYQILGKRGSAVFLDSFSEAVQQYGLAPYYCPKSPLSLPILTKDASVLILTKDAPVSPLMEGYFQHLIRLSNTYPLYRNEVTFRRSIFLAKRENLTLSLDLALQCLEQGLFCPDMFYVSSNPRKLEEIRSTKVKFLHKSLLFPDNKMFKEILDCARVLHPNIQQRKDFKDLITEAYDNVGKSCNLDTALILFTYLFEQDYPLDIDFRKMLTIFIEGGRNIAPFVRVLFPYMEKNKKSFPVSHELLELAAQHTHDESFALLYQQAQKQGTEIHPLRDYFVHNVYSAVESAQILQKMGISVDMSSLLQFCLQEKCISAISEILPLYYLDSSEEFATFVNTSIQRTEEHCFWLLGFCRERNWNVANLSPLWSIIGDLEDHQASQIVKYANYFQLNVPDISELSCKSFTKKQAHTLEECLKYMGSHDITYDVTNGLLQAKDSFLWRKVLFQVKDSITVDMPRLIQEVTESDNGNLASVLFEYMNPSARGDFIQILEGQQKWGCLFRIIVDSEEDEFPSSESVNACVKYHHEYSQSVFHAMLRKDIHISSENVQCFYKEFKSMASMEEEALYLWKLVVYQGIALK